MLGKRRARPVRNSFFVLLLTASAAGASPYAGAGAVATFGSGHPAWMLGIRRTYWRAELGGHFLDRERGKSAATGSLGPTITAERFDLRTRFFYSDLSWRLSRRDTGKPSGLEMGFGPALMRIVKDTRIERNGGLPELFSHDVVWRVLPVFRIAYIKPTEGRIEFGVDGRVILSGNSHGGKSIGGWSFSLSARFHPLAVH